MLVMERDRLVLREHSTTTPNSLPHPCHATDATPRGPRSSWSMPKQYMFGKNVALGCVNSLSRSVAGSHNLGKQFYDRPRKRRLGGNATALRQRAGPGGATAASYDAVEWAQGKPLAPQPPARPRPPFTHRDRRWFAYRALNKDSPDNRQIPKYLHMHAAPPREWLAMQIVDHSRLL